MISDPSYKNDQELLKLIAAGNPDAFTAFFDTHRNHIYSVGLKLLKSPGMAEELVQDVFLKIWVKRALLSEVNDLEAYLFILTRNEVYQVFRKLSRQKRLFLHLSQQQDISDTDTDLRILSKNYDSLLRESVKKLSTQQRLVYQLIKEKGLKREEAAARLNLHPDTIKTHLAQAMKNIRASFKANLEFYIWLIILASPK